MLSPLWGSSVERRIFLSLFRHCHLYSLYLTDSLRLAHCFQILCHSRGGRGIFQPQKEWRTSLATLLTLRSPGGQDRLTAVSYRFVTKTVIGPLSS